MNIPSYYSNPECNRLTNTLISARPSREGWLLELEDTIFYPEGGGQPSDRGSINGIPLLDVKQSDGKILHLCPEKPEGDVLTLLLDRPHREHYRIQHSAQHLLSSVLKKICNAATVSVHLGQEESSIEIDRDNLSDQELLMVEDEANKEIRAGRTLRAILVENQDELKNYTLRRETKRSEDIRLVEIEGLDVTPCGGLHVNNTTHIGLIKYAGQEKIRGHQRLRWKIGSPAYEDYRQRFKQIEIISALLSAQPYKASEHLKELLEENNELKRQNKSILKDQAVTISRQLTSTLNQYPPLIIREIETSSAPLFKEVVKILSLEEKLSFLICSSGKDRLLWALHLPDYQNFNFEEFKSKCLSLIDGKGGGRTPLWQGSGANPPGADAFLNSFKELVPG